MQRRLFLFFILFSLAPVMVVMTINWQINQDLLTYLGSPGIRHSLESSLTMARNMLAGEKRELTTDAGVLVAALPPIPLISADILPDPPPGCSYALVPLWRDDTPLTRGAPAVTAILPAHADDGEPPQRVEPGGIPGLLTVLPVHRPDVDYKLILFRPLDRELLDLMDSVVQGGGRFRQLRLYYGDLLRSDTLFILVALGLILLFTSLWLSLRLSRQIGAPLKELLAGTEKVAAGDLTHRVDVKAPEEVGELVSAFNRMTGRLKESRDELLRAERVAAWQGIARRLAHEIKNPLTPITLAMHRLSSRNEDPVQRECVRAVLDETANLQRLADEFSLFARLPAPVLGDVDLAALARETATLYLEDRQVECRWEGWPTGAVLVEGDGGQLRQVLSNLIKNGVEAMGGIGTLTLTLESCDGSRVIVMISDTGPGFNRPPEELFVPYFTDKETGTGLGLAIARRIVEDHGGELEASSPPEGGAAFRLTLPVSRNDHDPRRGEMTR